MFVSAVLLAAGKGKRFKSATPKPLFKLGGKPLFSYSLSVLNSCASVKEIILVAGKENQAGIRLFLKRRDYRKVTRIVLGGLRRQDSVLCGLKVVDKRAKFVLIHDSARPLIDKKMIAAVLGKAVSSGAAVAGVPVKATIKRAKAGVASETLKREELWEIQTPQVFRKDLLARAFAKWGRVTVTDDASLVEMLGKPVHIIKGSYRNIKVTTPEDAEIAAAFLGKKAGYKYGK